MLWQGLVPARRCRARLSLGARQCHCEPAGGFWLGRGHVTNASERSSRSLSARQTQKRRRRVWLSMRKVTVRPATKTTRHTAKSANFSAPWVAHVQQHPSLVGVSRAPARLGVGRVPVAGPSGSRAPPPSPPCDGTPHWERHPPCQVLRMRGQDLPLRLGRVHRAQALRRAVLDLQSVQSR